MIVCTDSTGFAADLLGVLGSGWTGDATTLNADLARLAARLYGHRTMSVAEVPGAAAWSHVFAVETAEHSQFDVLVDWARAGAGAGSALPSGIVCLAGSGRGFHGFRDRPWIARPGNIHLSAHLTMPRDAVTSVADVIALAAVSVVETIDAMPGLAGRAGIKWVNDVLIDEAKVCGILAHLEASDRGMTSVVIGIGLNVEVKPDVPPTPFVPHVAALGDLTRNPAHCRRRVVLAALMTALDRNYRHVLSRGAPVLRQRYRERSVVIGRTVAVCAEDSAAESEVLAEGVIAALGEHLELIVRGYPQPFVRGRLILRPIEPVQL